jgi:hypothetical protein
VTLYKKQWTARKHGNELQLSYRSEEFTSFSSGFCEIKGMWEEVMGYREIQENYVQLGRKASVEPVTRPMSILRQGLLSLVQYHPKEIGLI